MIRGKKAPDPRAVDLAELAHVEVGSRLGSVMTAMYAVSVQSGGDPAILAAARKQTGAHLQMLRSAYGKQMVWGRKAYAAHQAVVSAHRGARDGTLRPWIQAELAAMRGGPPNTLPSPLVTI